MVGHIQQFRRTRGKPARHRNVGTRRCYCLESAQTLESGFPQSYFLIKFFPKKLFLFPLIRSVDKWKRAKGYQQRGKRGGNAGIIHALYTPVVENKRLICNRLFPFSTCPPGFHISLSPPKSGVWEAVLRRGSYPRLSPLVLPCPERDFAKKTSARLIPALPEGFPRVIPEIFPNQI